MDARRILVVESELEFAEMIRTTLEGYGLEVEVVADGSQALQLAKTSTPDLILLCVELPKMSGYSICNKLKKNPDLKGIPLVIMSADATPDIFEQHKKLKTRAEDYLIKPFPMEELVEKVSHLIGFSPFEVTNTQSLEMPEAHADEVTGHPYRGEPDYSDATLADDDEIPVEDGPVDGDEIAIAFDDDLPPNLEEIEIEDGLEEGDEPTKITIDSDIEMATDAAFAALEMPDLLKEGDGEMEVLSPSEAAHEKGMATAGEPLTAPPVDALEVEVSDEPLRLAATVHEGVEEVIAQAETADEPAAPEPTRARGSSSRPAVESRGADEGLQRRLQELERENRRLSDELHHAQVRSGDAASPFSRDRELLNLREVINKKEKEILDLKDDLDSKERQILDHKDKVRELERKARDMDEKILGVDREMMTTNERLLALQQDKDKLVEREKGVKARLEEAKAEIEKAYTEVDNLKGRHKEALERAEAEAAQALAEKAEELRGIQDEQRGEIERLRAQAASEVEALKAQQAEEIRQLSEQHESALAAARQAQESALAVARDEHRDEMTGLQARHQGELAALSQEHGAELDRLRGEQQTTLEEVRRQAEEREAQLTQENQTALDGLRRESQEAAERQREEQAAELQAMAEQHRQEIERREAEHAGEKEALRTEHRAEVSRLKAEHATELETAQAEHQAAESALRQEEEQQRQELEQRHKDRILGMEARHRQAAEELQGTIAEREQQNLELSGTLASTEQSLAETRAREAELEGSLRSSRETVADQEERIGEAERQIAALQDQVLRAFTKIRGDEQLAEKAKRALAVALTLLEEQRQSSVDGEPPQDQPQ